MLEKNKLILIGNMPDKLSEIAEMASELALDVSEVEDPDEIPHSANESKVLLALLVEENDPGQLEAWGIHLKASGVPYIALTDTSEEMDLTAFRCGALGSWNLHVSSAVMTLRLRNISDKLMHEQKLKARIRELERTTQRMKRYVGNVAHDLRGPLGKLINTSEVLLSGVESDSLETFYQIMARTSRRGFNLVNNILDMAALESGQLRIDQQACELAGLVGQVMSELDYLAKEKGIILQNTVDRQVMVLADEQRLLQVLTNLINNALKFTPRSGKIIVCATVVNDKVSVQVNDTGIGMNAETVAHLFASGEGHLSTLGTEGERGTGLGLNIAQEIVRAHGSDIQVYSKEGEGSTFSFQLPVYRE